MKKYFWSKRIVGLETGNPQIKNYLMKFAFNVYNRLYPSLNTSDHFLTHVCMLARIISVGLGFCCSNNRTVSTDSKEVLQEVTKSLLVKKINQCYTNNNV